jgi:hypothetical protein
MEDDVFNNGRGTGCSKCGATPVHIGTLCWSCWQAAQGKGCGTRGNSYALGPNGATGPALWSWRGGYQADRPVTFWDFTEGRIDT